MRRVAWWVGLVLAVGGGALAAVIGYAFTGWLLARPEGATPLDYVAFAVVSALVAAVGALPGLLVMLLQRQDGGRD